MDRSNVNRYYFFLRIALTLLILALLIIRIDIGQIFQAFGGLRLHYFLVSLSLVPINLFLQFLRWHYILRTAGVSASAGVVARSVVIGLTLGLATPGRIGEIGRSFLIPQAHPSQVTGLLILEKIFSFFTITLTAAVSIAMWKSWLFGAALLVIAVLGAYQLRLITSVLTRISFLLPYGRKVVDLWARWSRFTAKSITVLFGISIIFFIIVYIQFYLLIWAFQDLSLLPAIISLPLIIAVNSIPITVAGLGLRESASVFFLSQFGIAEAAALNSALLLFAIDLLIPGMIGLALLTGSRQADRKKEVRSVP